MSLSRQGVQITTSEKEARLRSLEAEVVSAGIPPSQFLPSFRKELRATPDPERAFNNFLRFIGSGFTSSLLRNFSDHPVLLNIALTLFSHSQYLSDILVRSPELFHWLTGTNVLTRPATPEDYLRDALSAIAPFEGTDKKFDALKRFQRREILKISARDILKEAEFAMITAELSWLADSIVDAAVRIALEDLNRRLGSETKSTFCVVGLGKLGGGELNFSSDIDLMFVYDADADLEFNTERVNSYHEYYCRIAEFVVRRLSERTDEGHLYRIDMRLRPDGSSGPLAMSREGYLRYYESRGELWERQMLLKARIIAGNKEVGEQFLNDLRPFVYPSTVLHDPREEILSIKKRIEAGLPGETNVKLSKGGIRDVEFIVQALQLLQPTIGQHWRESNTLKAIEKLQRSSLLTRMEGKQLQNSYIFLRQVEHRLQLLHGIQTHELPDNPEELRLLGRRLGFKSSSAFEKELLRTQKQVRKIYESVFSVSKGLDGMHRVQKGFSLQELKAMVARHGFVDAKRAVALIQQLRKASARFDQPDALGSLLRNLRTTGAPDYGLMNFLLLSSAQPLKRTLDQVMANERMFELILNVCARSKRLTIELAREPLLFESLLGRTQEFFEPGVEWQFLLKDDPVRFRSFNESKVVVGYFADAIPIATAARVFARIADTVVHSVINDLLDRFPESRGKLCFVALGKYGGEELLPGSDLDFMILFQSSGSSDSRDALEKSAIEFVRSFSTESGHVYDVDFRLRPEGKNAPLMTDILYYEQYLHKRAELWEKQALLKARIIFGENASGSRFSALRDTVLAGVAAMKAWPRQMMAMKARMERERTAEKTRQTDLKVGKGGLVDLEFIIQAVQLKYISVKGRIPVGNSFDAIDHRCMHDFMTKREVAMLKRNYTFLRSLELAIRLNSESNQFVLPQDDITLQAIAASVNKRSASKLKEKIKQVRSENRLLMEKVFRSIDR